VSKSFKSSSRNQILRRNRRKLRSRHHCWGSTPKHWSAHPQSRKRTSRSTLCPNSTSNSSSL